MAINRMSIGGEYPLSTDDLCRHTTPLQFPYLNDFHKVFFASGRGALRALLRMINGKSALLPNYICQSVILAFEQEGYTIDFYQINADYSIEIESVKTLILAADVLFIMHYFGFPQDQGILKTLKEACDKNSTVIIEDTTHSIFTLPLTCGNFAVSSLRKWFGLPDGAVAYSTDKSILDIERFMIKDSNFTNLRLIGMLQKHAYLSGSSEKPTLHLSLLESAENYLTKHPSLSCISEFSWQQLCCLRLKEMIECRRSNYELLYNEISHGGITIASPMLDRNTCPLFLVVKAARREALRIFLMEHQIYCPVHWPVEDQRLKDDQFLHENFGNNLSIPIDQRYNDTYMRYVASVLNEFESHE